MLELSKDEAKNFSAQVTQSKQHAYIKIETLHGNTVSIIHALLKEVCGNAILGWSTVQQQHKCFKLPIDDSRKTCKMRETRVCARQHENWLQTFWLFSHTIKFYPLSHEKIHFLVHSYSFYCETVQDMRYKICQMKQHKQHKITHTHVSCLACFSRLKYFSQIICSWL